MPTSTMNPAYPVNMGDEELELMHAMDEYKRRSGRMFPTWCEVLEVLQELGYRKPTGRNRIVLSSSA